MVFSPGTFAGAPHTDIATLTFADGGTTGEETALMKALADGFPAVSVIRVKDALDAVDRIVGKLVLALRGASAVTLIAAALVLGGALAAGQRFRIYDAVVLKDPGCDPPAPVLAAYASRIFADRPCRRRVRGRRRARSPRVSWSPAIMEFSFVWVAPQAIGAALAALLVTVALGLLGTFAALGHKPAQVLRNF